jgi:hypothetical protein
MKYLVLFLLVLGIGCCDRHALYDLEVTYSNGDTEILHVNVSTCEGPHLSDGCLEVDLDDPIRCNVRAFKVLKKY